MKKLLSAILCLLAASVLSMGTVAAFADEEEQVVTEVSPEITEAETLTEAVEAPKKTVKNIHLNYSKKTVNEEKTFTLKLLQSKYKEKIIWKSSNEEVATVSGGAVTAHNAGTAEITASYGDKTYYCKVTVRTPAINIKAKNCIPGDSFKLSVSGAKGLTYSSSDKRIATVSSKGKVKIKRVGTAVIKVTDSKGRTYTCNISAYDNAKNSINTVVSYDYDPETGHFYKPSTNAAFTAVPGMLVNYTNCLVTSGDPEGLIYLKDSKITKILKYEKSVRLQESIIEPLSKMLEDCKAATKYAYYEMNFYGGYRDFNTQTSFWRNHITQDPNYGKDAYVSGTKTVPGSSSEHRTGYAVDILTGTKSYDWLRDNSYKYGFIKRYSGKKTAYTGVMEEEWHFTYVGEAVAKVCFEEDLCLEEYYEKYVLPAAGLVF